MGYRIFRDSAGTEWQAWDVVPRLSERRLGERRARAAAVPRPERRRVERRVQAGRRPLLSAGLDNGWLCFEAPVEKRRLAPIPSDWLSCATARLEEYLRAAKLARTTPSSTDIVREPRD